MIDFHDNHPTFFISRHNYGEITETCKSSWEHEYFFSKKCRPRKIQNTNVCRKSYQLVIFSWIVLIFLCFFFFLRYYYFLMKTLHLKRPKHMQICMTVTKQNATRYSKTKNSVMKTIKNLHLSNFDFSNVIDTHVGKSRDWSNLLSNYRAELPMQ